MANDDCGDLNDTWWFAGGTENDFDEFISAAGLFPEAQNAPWNEDKIDVVLFSGQSGLPWKP